MSVRIGPVTLRISRNVVWVFKPPSVCQVSFCQIKACSCFGYTTCYTSDIGQIVYCCQQVRKYGFGIDLRYCVTYRGSHGRCVELQFP